MDPVVVLQQQASAGIDTAALQEEIARLAPSAQSYGYEWDGHEWDRLSLLAAALIANPEIARARAHVASVEAEAKAARYASGFSLGLTTEYAFNAPESSPWLLGAIGDLPLDTGTRREARIGAAELNARIALFDYLETVWSVRLRIRQALAEYLLSGRESGLARELNELHTRTLNAMQRRLIAGAASHADIERIRMSAAADQQRLSEAEARTLAAALQISAALGIPDSELDPSALTWSAVEAPRVLADGLSANCLDAALLARPDIARASRRYDLAEEALRSVVAAQYPALHIGPGYTWERGLNKLPFALGLSLPSLDLNHSAIAAAEALRAEAGRELEATVASSHNSVVAALADYHAARIKLDNSRQQTTIAQSLAMQAEAALDAGAIDRNEW
ncbi:MAG: TolC family protein, partial [Lysobacterales bacterium]